MNILQISSSYFETSLYKRLFAEQERLNLCNYIYVPRCYENKEDEDNHIFVIDKKYSKVAKFLYWGEQKYILKDIEKKITLSDINLIHVHRILYGGYAALQIKKKYGIPYIVAIRFSDIYGFSRNMSLYKVHCWNIIKDASRVIFISKPYEEKVLNSYHKNIQNNRLASKFNVIPNGIDGFFFEKMIRINTRPLPLNKQIKLISIGTIDKRKNYLTTLVSIDLLINMGYEVSLKYAGKIKDNSIFEKIKKKPYAEYLGVLNKEQICEAFLSADIFVLPSIYETFGLVYAEAMTQGLPVIYTRGQGFDGQYKDGEIGFAVDCHNAKEIANRILDVLANYRVISNNCINYSKRYSWERIANIYKDIYVKSSNKDVAESN